MQKIKLSDTLSMSRLVHGHWRLVEWDLSDQELLSLAKQTYDLGISTFDHADIYGDYECETLFGNALKLDSAFREQIEIVTKCGIKILSEKHPERNIGTYDYSKTHILSSVENSLRKLNTDRIDLLLLHRPAPFFDPTEVAEAFDQLFKSGKVLNFGVSNFTPAQFDSLQAHLNQKLVTNQLEISPYCLEHFDNENISFCQQHNIKPMAWSPLAGGSIFSPQDEKGHRVLKAIEKVAGTIGTSVDKVIYAWILKHPAQVMPVIGSGKIERIKTAVEAIEIEMSLEQWYEIYIAAKGAPLP